MGIYATTTSFGEILPGFYKGGSSTSDTAGAAVVDRMITRAEAKLNSILAIKYSLPFATVPPLVRTLSEDLACYYIVRNTNYQDGKEKNKYLENFQIVFDDLAELMKGVTKLTLTDGSTVPVNSRGRILSSSLDYAQIFNKDEPTSWKPSAAELDDITDTREL